MDKTEYLKMLKEQSENNSKIMSDTARAIAFAIIGFAIADTDTTKLTYLFLLFVLLFFIVDFIQYLFMWQSSKKLFVRVQDGEIDGIKGNEIDKKNKKWAFRFIVFKFISLAISLLILGYV